MLAILDYVTQNNVFMTLKRNNEHIKQGIDS